MKELDTVALTHEMPARALEIGDVGVIVHCHSADVFEVEFIGRHGDSVCVIPMSRAFLRPIGRDDIIFECGT